MNVDKNLEVHHSVNHGYLEVVRFYAIFKNYMYFLNKIALEMKIIMHCKPLGRKFPAGLVVRAWHFHCSDLGSIPGQGNKVLQASCAKKKKKKFNN